MKPHIDPAALLASVGWVQRLARSLLEDEALAADLAQDALTVAIEQPPAYEGTRSQLRSWLGGVARTLALREKHGRIERHWREARIARPEATRDEEQANERLRLHEQLTHAVMNLAEPYRSTIVLRFFDDLPPREIAPRKGITAATVRQHLSRGLEQLRARLDREHGDRRAWRGALIGLCHSGLVPLKVAAGTALGIVIMNKFVLAGLAALVLSLGLWAYQSSAPTVEFDPPNAGAVSDTLASSDALAQPKLTEPERQRVAVEEPAILLDFVIEAADPYGKPISGAKVWRLQEAGELQKAKTDRGGQAHFAPVDAAGSLLVYAEAFLPATRKLDRLGGTQRLTLNQGSELQGWLRVEGEVPAEPIRLELRFNEAAVALDLLAEIAEDSAETLAANRATTTGPMGEFHFRGLPEDWSGALLLPQQYWFREENANPDSLRELFLSGPQTDLHLDATQLPLVSGRVVWEGDGSPVLDAYVGLMVRLSENPRNSKFYGWGVESDGSFRIGLSPGDTSQRRRWLDPASRPALAEVVVTVSSPAARERLKLTFDSEDLQVTTDLGTIALQRNLGQELNFLIQNRAGESIEGAYVLGEKLSSATDKDGRGTLEPRMPRANSWLVGALGYRLAELEPTAGDGTEEHPLVLVLGRGNQLQIHLIDPAGNPPVVTQVHLSAPIPLYDGGEGSRPTRIHGAVATDIPSYGWGPHEVNVQLWPDASGIAVLASIIPDTPIHIEVRDRLGQVLLGREITGPGAMENQSVDLLVSQSRVILSGRVLDEHGEPVPNAIVKLTRGLQWIEERSDIDGRFTFGDLYESENPVVLIAERPGYATFRMDGIALRSGNAPIEVQLLRGHDLRIRVVDSEGRAVSADQVSVDLPEPIPRGDPLGNGVFVFSDLPTGVLRFTCKVSGREFELRHNPVVPRATLVVQLPGK